MDKILYDVKRKIVNSKKSEIVDIKDLNYEAGTIIDIIDDSIIVKTITNNKGILLSGLSVFGLHQLVSKIYLKRLLTVGIKLSNAI